jgi:hypothetical protein
MELLSQQPADNAAAADTNSLLFAAEEQRGPVPGAEVVDREELPKQQKSQAENNPRHRSTGLAGFVIVPRLQHQEV